MNEFLAVPHHLRRNLIWVVEFLDQWLDRQSYALGGGTVLAARWQHRLSTYIYLFMELNLYRSIINRRHWHEVSNQLSELARRSEIKELRTYSTGFTCVTQMGPISVFGAARITEKPISSEIEQSTGISTESTAEILMKKIRARMVNGTEYVARDLYDLIVAYMLDRSSLDVAFNSLDELERESLKYDVTSGDTKVRNLDRVIEPKCLQLTERLDRFNSIAGEVLSQNVSISTERFLQESFRTSNLTK